MEKFTGQDSQYVDYLEKAKRHRIAGFAGSDTLGDDIESISWEKIYGTIQKIIVTAELVYSANAILRFLEVDLPFGLKKLPQGIKVVDRGSYIAKTATLQIGLREGKRVQKISLLLGKVLYNNFPKRNMFNYSLLKGGILDFQMNIFCTDNINEKLELYILEANNLLMYHCE